MRINRGTWRVMALCAATVAAIAVLWRSDILIGFAERHILSRLLPIAVGRDVRITAFKRSTFPTPDAVPGATLRLSAARAKSMLAAALPAARFLIPPRLPAHGTSLDGDLLLRGDDGFGVAQLPLRVVIDDTVGYSPLLVVCMSAVNFNAFLKAKFEKRLVSRIRYARGHADLLYDIRFTGLRIHSEISDAAQPVRSRTFPFQATGQVRLRLEKNAFVINTTGNITHFNGAFVLRPVRDKYGFGLNLVTRIDGLDVNLPRTHNRLDRSASKALRKVLDKALNRQRNRLRLARLRLPYWVPQDLQVELELLP